MSPLHRQSAPPRPTPTPSENTSIPLKSHLRAFEYAKMHRIVAANADTPAGAALRKKSTDQASSTAPLLPKRAHWTSEERWEAVDTREREREGESHGDVQGKGVGKSWEQQQDTEMVGEDHPEGMRGEVRAGERSERKESLGSRAGGQLLKAFTGYVGKKDEYSVYPI